MKGIVEVKKIRENNIDYTVTNDAQIPIRIIESVEITDKANVCKMNINTGTWKTSFDVLHTPDELQQLIAASK